MKDCRRFEKILVKESGERSKDEEVFLEEHAEVCYRCGRLAQAADKMESALSKISATPAPEYLSYRVAGSLIRESGRREAEARITWRMKLGWLLNGFGEALVWGVLATIVFIAVGKVMMVWAGYSVSYSGIFSVLGDKLGSLVTVSGTGGILTFRIKF